MSLLNVERDPGWIACIDFGTAFSKSAMVRALARREVKLADIKPLLIAEREGQLARNSFLLPSAMFVHEERIVFGQEAEDDAIRFEGRNRHAFRSLKQYLSSHDLTELDEPLPADIDPSGLLAPRTALVLFLAYLLERAGASAKKQRLPWPVRVRIARPAWNPERARRGEAELKSIVRRSFRVVDHLGEGLSRRGGVPLDEAMEAVQEEAHGEELGDDRLYELDSAGNATILEATAVAAGSIRDTGRRVVAIADIGGGTSDFGVFMTGLAGRNVLAEISGSAQALRKAGDHLDMLLSRHVLDRLGYLADDPAGRGVANRLRRRQRGYKESLFSDGSVRIDLGDDVLEVQVSEFLADARVEQFRKELRDKFDATLGVAIECAKAYPPRFWQRTPVEILLTGGGHDLPMVRELYEDPSRDWKYSAPAPDFIPRSEEFELEMVRRQMVVAIGGALRDLPTVTVPVRLQG